MQQIMGSPIPCKNHSTANKSLCLVAKNTRISQSLTRQLCKGRACFRCFRRPDLQHFVLRQIRLNQSRPVMAFCGLSLKGLSLTAGVMGSLGIATAFVGSLYMIPSPHHRDHPKTIFQRICAVSSVTVAAPFAVYSLCHAAEKDTGECLWQLIGFRSNWIKPVAASLFLNILLFAGPLLQDMLHGFDVPERDLVFVRNLIIAPIAEEVVFRGCIVPLLVPHFGSTAAIFLAPLFFGLAHLHHLLAGQSPVAVLFQFMYTTVFGWFCAALFVRTGHIAGPILCHAFCNTMGFPAFGEAASSPHRKLLAVTYVAGLLGFTMLLLPLTNPALFHH